MEITGKKGGGSVHTPVQQSDTVQSNARMKMLLALSEGELPNNVTAKNIFLNGTPLENSDGTKNFDNVDWEFRPGTQSQEAISGFSAAESVTQVSVALKAATPWVIQLSDTSLDAVLITMGITSGLYETKLNGDMVGSTVNYKIEVATDGGSYKELINKTVTEMISSNYELTHRVDLPEAKSSWLVRVTRITPDSTSARLVNATSVDSYTTVIDAKLRYPNTALLYVAFSGKQFSSTPTVSVLVDGKIIRVPSNYDTTKRTYSGSWDGTFKWASSNNPAWVWLDVLTNERYGLGKRVNVDMVDKWELYRISQYCDQLVDDGKGGTEPRFLFDAYIQTAEDAWQIISDIAASFNGLSGWANNQFTVASDIPPNTDGSKIFTRANIVNGKITKSGGKLLDQYTSAAISFRDKTNHYNDATTGVMIPELVSKFGYRQLKLTPVGCTRESEAKRRGKWAVYTNYVDQNYTFQVGEEGLSINVGEHIFIADEKVSGKVYGGRLVSASSDGKTLTLDRQTDAVAGDSIKVRCTGGVVKTSVIKSVSGFNVTVADTLAPIPAAVFVIDAQQIKLQGVIVRGKTFDDGANTYTITADEYNPSKQSAVDGGTAIEIPVISSLPSTVIGLPKNLSLKQQEQLQQGQRVVSIIGSWDAPDNNSVIDYYQIQWKKDSGEWVSVQNTALRSFSVTGVFSGTYTFRVCAVLTNGRSSLWATSDAVNIVGRTGAVPVPTNLAVKGKVFGVDISWSYPTGSDDVNNVLIQVADDNKGTNAATLSSVSYPATSYGRSDMAAGVSKWYRIKAVDKNGFESDFTSWVNGVTSSDAGAILEYISGKIAKTDLAQQLISDIDSKATSADLSTANAAIAQAQKDIVANKQTAANDVADAKKQASDAVAQAKSQASQATADLKSSTDKAISQTNTTVTSLQNTVAANKKTADDAAAQAKADLASTNTSLSNSINAEAKARADAILNEQNSRQADISTVKTLIQNGDQSLATQIAKVAAGSGDQFDSLDIWYFDDKSADGWTSSGGNPAVSADGWLSPAAGNDPYLTSPTGLAFDSTAYRFVKLRIRKVGSPVWQGELRWRAKGASFDNTSLYRFAEPLFDDNGVVTVAISDIPWTGTATIDAIRLDLTAKTDANNYVECDWIAIGRPTPAAGMAALQDEQTARVTADAAEAASRNTLAVQLRGSYDGSDLSKVSSGLIAQESQARVTADQANAQSTTALGTKLDSSVSTINQSISTLNTKQTATATDVTNLQSSLKTTNDNLAKKADASAVTSLSNTVTQQGNAITSTAQDVTNLQGSITSGNNLVPNPDLTASGAGWTPTGTAVDGSRVYVSSGANYQPTTKNFDVNAGDTLVVSAELYCDKAIAVELRFRFDGPSMSNNTQTIQTITLAVNTWTTYGGSVVVPAGATTAQLQVTHSSGTVRLANASVFAQNVSSAAFSALNTKVSQQGDTITSQGSSITSLNNAIGKKADATALNDLSTKVTQQGNTITSQGNSITSLTNTVNNKADSSALSNLSSKVDSQGNTITSQGNSITSLNNTVKNKADQSALDALSSTVKTQGDNISTQSDRVTKLETTITTGANLVPNPTMLNNANGWAFDTVGVMDGYNYVESNSGYNPHPAQFIVSPGQVIDVSLSARFANAVSNFSWQVRFDGPSMSNVTQNFTSDSYGATEHKTVTGTVTVPDGATLAYIQPSAAVPSGNSLRIWNVSAVVRSSADIANATAISNLTTTVSKQGDTITSQGNSITSLNNAIGKKADATALNDLSTKVTQQGNTITSQGNSITSLTNTVNNKADTSALNSLSATVTQQGKDISSQSKNITSLTSQVNNISVGGTNIFAGTAAGKGATVDTSQTFRGNAVVKASKSKDDTGSYTNVWELVPNENLIGSTYVLSFWAKADTDGTRIVSYFYSPNSTLTATNGAGETGTGSDGSMGNTLTTSWAKYYVVWTQKPTDSNKRVIIGRINKDTSKDQVVYISSPKFEEGNVPTDWSPNPDDVAGDIAAVSTAVSSLTTTVKNQGDSITSQGNSITSINNTLKNKADASAVTSLSSTVSSQGDSISTLNNNVTALQASLTSGNNLLANPDLLNGAAGWSGSSNGKDGSRLYSEASYDYAPNSKLFDVTPGDTLKVSGDVWADAAGSVSIRIRFDGPSMSNNTITAQQITIGAKTWTTLAGTVTVPSGAATGQLQVTHGGTARLANPSVFAQNVTADAFNSLTNTVKTQGDTITSQGNSITSLNNTIKNKADTSALNDLSSKVTSQGNTISSQADQITSLTASTGLAAGAGNNLIQDGGFETYVSSNPRLLSDGAHRSGSKSVKVVRVAGTNTGGNNDVNYGNRFSVRGGAKIYIEIFARYDANSAAQTGSFNCGLNCQNTSGANSWRGAFTINQSDLPTNNSWVKYSGYADTPSDAVNAQLWFSVPQNSSNVQGVSILVDDVYAVDATEGYKAGQDSSANADAISTLSGKVTQQGNTITSQGNSITSLTNTVNNKADSSALSSLSNTVSQQGSTITSQGNRVTSLENNLTVGDNIVPNPTMLNNAAGWTGDSSTIDGYPAVSSSVAYAPSSSKFTVTAGDVIDFSLMCQAAAAVSGLAWGIRFDGPSLSNKTAYVASQDYTANEKKSVSGTITVPSGATTGYLQPNSNTTVKLSIYNIDVTRRNIGVVANSSAISNLSSTVSKQGDTITSQGNAITSLNSQIGQKASASSVSDLSTKVTQQGDSISSQATQISSLNSTVGDNTAKISQTSSTVSGLNGKVAASFTLKIETNVNGNNVVTGFGAGADAQGNNQFLVYANRFALITTQNKQVVTPFAIDNGQVFIDTAFIKDASIGSAKVGDIMSNGFQENTQGWRLSKDGSLNINPYQANSGQGRFVLDNNGCAYYDGNGKIVCSMGVQR